MYDCFISFKKQVDGNLTEDFHIARHIYELLTNIGLSVFFSEKSLEKIGSARFREEIDNALDSAKFLIVIGSSLENINSGWVKYEWDSYSQDILRGKNKDGMIYTVVKNISPDMLPSSLRNSQVFPATHEGYVNLHNFVVNKFHQSTSIKEDTAVCKNCGRIFDINSPRGCSYHPSEPVRNTVLNFNNSTVSKWQYPCCGVEVESNEKPLSQFGCMQGFHRR